MFVSNINKIIFTMLMIITLMLSMNELIITMIIIIIIIIFSRVD